MGGGTGGRFGGTRGSGYSANGNPYIRAIRRPLYDTIRNNGVTVNGKTYKLSPHAYNKFI